VKFLVRLFWVAAIALLVYGVHYTFFRPKPMPEVTLADLSGKQVSLSDYEGMVIVLNFWATWCPPCVHEIPALIKLHSEYAGSGLVVIGIALDGEGQKKVGPFAQQAGMNYPVLLGADGVAAKAFGGVRGIPTTFFIDRSGRIRQKIVGGRTYAQFEQAVEELVAEPVPEK